VQVKVNLVQGHVFAVGEVDNLLPTQRGHVVGNGQVDVVNRRVGDVGFGRVDQPGGVGGTVVPGEGEEGIGRRQGLSGGCRGPGGCGLGLVGRRRSRGRNGRWGHSGPLGDGRRPASGQNQQGKKDNRLLHK